MLFRACKQARNYLLVTVRVGAFYAPAAHELSMVVSLDEKGSAKFSFVYSMKRSALNERKHFAFKEALFCVNCKKCCNFPFTC